MQTIQIGTVSHGTLRTEDLLEAFADELERIGGGDVADYVAQARDWRGKGYEFANDILETITEILNEYAPLCCYFGAHPGDGSDFGFWPDMDSIEYEIQCGDMVRISDPSDFVAGTPAVYVNDHGNVTIYNADGSVAWDCV